MSSSDCPKAAVDLASQSRLEGFPDKNAMATNRYVISGVQSVLLVLGLLVNCIICYVMVKRRKIKKTLSNFFLFNLSLTELLLWLVVLPLTMVISMSKVQSTLPCKFLAFSIFTCAAVIFGLLAAIAIDRYINIMHPLKAIAMEERRVTPLVVIWIIAVATSAPFLFSVTMRTVTMEFLSSNVSGVITVKMLLHRGSDVINMHTTNITDYDKIAATYIRDGIALGNGSEAITLNTTKSTTCLLPMQVCDIPANIKGQASCIVFFVVSFVAPLLMISFAYTKIVQRLWHRRQAKDDQGLAAKATLRAVRMLVLVVFAFLLTDGPWTVGCLIYSFRPSSLITLQSHFTAIAIVTTLFYASAVITPTIHAVHSSTVQKEIIAIVCCKFRAKAFSSSTSSLLSAKRYTSIHFARNQNKLSGGSINT